jgi:hypothetical protein
VRSAQRRPCLGAALAFVAGIAGCSGARAAPAAPATVLDLDGLAQQPLQVAPGTVHVLVFLSQECPIANGYAPTLQALAGSAPAPQVRWFLVHVDPELGAAAARDHATAYGLPGTVVLDPQHQLARALGVTRTPEAAVLGAAGLCYRGRIDDQWAALGSRRPAPTSHELQAAVELAADGRATPGPWPAAIGCLLPEPGPR